MPDHPVTTELREIAKQPAEATGRLSKLLRPEQPALLLPLSGLWIFALDWLLFSSNAASLGLATPISVGLGFLAGGAGTFFLQRRFGGDAWWKAALKALGAGIAVGAPWPIGGSLIGGWILLASGMRSSAIETLSGHNNNGSRAASSDDSAD